MSMLLDSLGGFVMRIRNIAILGAAVFAGAVCGSLIGPHPAEAVAREIIDLQRDVTSLLQGQKDLSTQMTQDHTVIKTIVGGFNDNISHLSGSMGSLQKSVQDMQANSGTRLDTMSTQVQGLSDNLEEIKSRLGKLNQQLVDLQTSPRPPPSWNVVRRTGAEIFRHPRPPRSRETFSRQRRRTLCARQAQRTWRFCIRHSLAIPRCLSFLLRLYRSPLAQPSSSSSSGLLTSVTPNAVRDPGYIQTSARSLQMQPTPVDKLPGCKCRAARHLSRRRSGGRHPRLECRSLFTLRHFVGSLG